MTSELIWRTDAPPDEGAVLAWMRSPSGAMTLDFVCYLAPYWNEHGPQPDREWAPIYAGDLPGEVVCWAPIPEPPKLP